MYRSSTSSSHIVRLALVFLLAAAFLVAVASPAMALTRGQKRVIKIIKREAHKKGYGSYQTGALVKIAYRESRYHPKSRTGSCKGLFQIWTKVGRTKWANPVWSTRRAIRYIKHRYGTPRRALAHSYRYGWY